MLGNYLKTGVRNIFKNKAHSLINIIGLAVGLAACMLIAIYVINEESYDNFNTNADRIVRATMIFSIGGVTQNVAITGTKLLPESERNFPEVETGVRIYATRAIVKYNDKTFGEPNFLFTDSTFFKVFSYKLIQGNSAQALTKSNSVILTTSTAKKYFGNENPIGKVISINTRNLAAVRLREYTVTGIAEDCPTNSQIKFDFLASFCSLPQAKPGNEMWWEADYYTYLLLKSPQSIKSLQDKISSYMKLQKDELGLTGNDYMTFRLEPLRSVHLHSEAMGSLEPSGDSRYVLIFSLVALLILGIACANYINITTAKASERAKEVGVRKVIGANQIQLFYQFIAESFIIVGFSLLLGLAIAAISLQAFKNLAGIQLQLSSLFSSSMILILGLIVVSIGLLGAGYPAYILTRFQPIKVLKGNFKTGTSGVWLRKSLIVFQFVISIGLIVCTFIIKDQLDYIHNKKLGYNKNNIVIFPVDESITGRITVLKNEFMKNSNITGVTFATRTPVFINSKNNLEYDNKKLVVNQLGVDTDFLQTLGVQLIAGSNFTDADTVNYMSRGSFTGLPIIVNETALRQLNLTPAKAIGELVIYGKRNCVIKGVIKDFNFASMHESINPLVLFPKGYLNKMMVKISGENLQATINYMKKTWETLIPDHPFDMTFLNDDFSKLYLSEARTQDIFYVFGILAVVLAYLGLFGLISFSVRQRTKEIGIRRILGANVKDIITVFSKDYIKLIITANIIACPIAWYAASKWLEGFAYRTEINVSVFLAVTILTFTLAIVLIGTQSIKTATANPVEALRYE